jgi:hypothetical protein
MVRKIRFDQIDDYARDQIRTLVQAATLETDRQLKLLTPVDTGRLRNSWQVDQQEFSGSVYSNLPYAEPVVAGTGLPPSWGGKYRTRQNAAPFLAVVEKNIQTYVDVQADRIGRSS